jgi:CRP/FNR family cyclic AMP-dependent transcriptional regulator
LEKTSETFVFHFHPFVLDPIIFPNGKNINVTTLASNVRSVLLSASEVGPLHRLRRESVLFHQRQEAVGVFLIEAGLVKLTRTSKDGGRLILSVAGSNQLVGEECLTQGSGCYFASSACVTEVTGYHVPIFTLRRLLAVPELAHSLMSYVVARNREAIQKVEMLTLRDVEYRVLHGLASLASLVKPSPDGLAFPIPMTQAEIASFIGATRETTSTTLSMLKVRQLVSLSRRLITTVHPDILISAANDRLTHSGSAA